MYAALVLVCSLGVATAGIPFGKAGPQISIKETEGFLPPAKFFKEYALPSKPIVMRGACKVWPAYEKWTDDEYFINASPDNFFVALNKKRGLPESKKEFVDFKMFVKNYTSSSRRMIANTPPFLQEDVRLPGSLQCKDIEEGKFLMGHKMWYGFNYTTSAVHKDAADNINCLVHGVKDYTLVSVEDSVKIFLDKPNGLYSTMDVDDVDANKFPDLEKITYHTVTLNGGDCIFVPYKWIHQVRSYKRNIAINTWWNYWMDGELDLSTCKEKPGNAPSIGTPQYTGWGDFETRYDGVKEHITDLFRMTRRKFGIGKFTSFFLSADKQFIPSMITLPQPVKDDLRTAFNLIDTNRDSRVDITELNSLPKTIMDQVVPLFQRILGTVRELGDEYERQQFHWKQTRKQEKTVKREY